MENSYDTGDGYKCFKCGEWIAYGILHKCPPPPPDTRPKVYCIDCKYYRIVKHLLYGDTIYCELIDVDYKEDPILGKYKSRPDYGYGFCRLNKEYHCPKYEKTNKLIRLYRRI